MISHSREGGIAKTGVVVYIGIADSPEGGQHDAVRHSVLKDSVHPELVEGFIKFFMEWFEKLTLSVNYWIPAFAGMT